MRRLAIEDAEKRHSDLVRGQIWKGQWAKYSYRCPAHGLYRQSFHSHDQGSRCHKCGIVKIHESQKLTIEGVEKRYPDFVCGQIWKGSSAKYKFLCDDHGVYRQEFNSHDKGSGCPKCWITRKGEQLRLTIREAEKRYPDMIRGQTWKGAIAKYNYACKIHGIYSQQFSSHDRSGCPKCCESLGEKAVASYLDKIGLPFERQKRFDSCRNLKPLPFDFYITSLRTLIEYHGGQHYRPVERWGGIKTLRGIQHRDGIKRRWSRKNGYMFIVVPYTVKNTGMYLAKRLGNLCEQKAA